jgi:hypothetical protein
VLNTSLAGELAKKLRELADKTVDPVYKEKLITAAKIIKDSSIFIHIQLLKIHYKRYSSENLVCSACCQWR